jgi:hypothetical protein
MLEEFVGERRSVESLYENYGNRDSGYGRTLLRTLLLDGTFTDLEKLFQLGYEMTDLDYSLLYDFENWMEKENFAEEMKTKFDFLFSKGLKVNKTDGHDSFPAHFSTFVITLQNIEMLHYFLDKGLNINGNLILDYLFLQNPYQADACIFPYEDHSFIDYLIEINVLHEKNKRELKGFRLEKTVSA